MLILPFTFHQLLSTQNFSLKGKYQSQILQPDYSNSGPHAAQKQPKCGPWATRRSFDKRRGNHIWH